MHKSRLNTAALLIASIWGDYPRATVSSQPDRGKRDRNRYRGGGGTKQHTSRPMAVLISAAAMASPAARYDDKPRLAVKRRRALDRALRRGRRSQIEAAMVSYTGGPRWSPSI